jgi:hypothetical protein
MHLHRSLKKENKCEKIGKRRENTPGLGDVRRTVYRKEEGKKLLYLEKLGSEIETIHRGKYSLWQKRTSLHIHRLQEHKYSQDQASTSLLVCFSE